MSWLLDVNLILASRWTTHAQHLAAKAWVDATVTFCTCAILSKPWRNVVVVNMLRQVFGQD
jgi:hypothetical protein